MVLFDSKEELKEEIIELLLKPINCKMFSDVWLEHKADQILTLIRKAGWKSPDQIPNATICPKCNEMHWIK